jgi:RNA polymerase sigma factor (sigma-70 family)
MDDDATLLRRYLHAGSQEAFTALVQHYFRLVYAAALRRTNGDPHRAGDVAQMVFSSFAREARRLPRETVLAGWFYVATRNAALNLQRGERRRRVYEQQAHAMNVELREMSSGAEWEKLRPLLDAAMDELPAKDRDAVLLRFFEAQTYGAVAQTLNLSEDAARMRVDRALEKLRRALERFGVTSTASALGLLLTHQAGAAVPSGLAISVAAAAFASAWSSATSPLVSFFALMNTTKAFTAAALVALLALGAAFYESKQARESRSAMEAMRADREQLLQRLAAEAGEGLTETKKPPLAAVGAPPFVSTPVVISTPTPIQQNPPPPISSGLLRPGNPLGSLYALRGDAAAMEAWLKAERSGLDLQLGPLWASLALTPEQTERVKGILMERFEALVDLIGAAEARGKKMSDPEVKASYQAAVDKMENELHTLLGDSGYEQLKQYGATTSIREVVRSLAGNLYHTATPLTSPQAEQLVQLVATHSRQNDPATTDWAKVYADAAQFLAPAQIATLHAEQEQVMLRARLDQIGKSVVH